MANPSPVPPSTADSVAFLVLAHSDPVHVRRLTSALAPFPVYLHCDRRTSEEQFAEMSDGIPAERIIAPREACQWARWGLVAAEVTALRQALATSTAEHFVVMTGADYPLAPTSEIGRFLSSCSGRSIAPFRPMPLPNWGSSGGLARIRYRHYGWRKQMIRIPVPRAVPQGIVPSGGSQQKILSRKHAAKIVWVHDNRPDLVRFWRRSWSADETFMPTILLSPQFGIDWPAESLHGQAWWIGWNGSRMKSPPVLTTEHFDRLREGRFPQDGAAVPKFFARKFSTDVSADVLDRIDDELRSLAGAY